MQCKHLGTHASDKLSVAPLWWSLGHCRRCPPALITPNWRKSSARKQNTTCKASQVANQKTVSLSKIASLNTKHATAVGDQKSKKAKLAVLTTVGSKILPILLIVGVCDLMRVKECVLCYTVTLQEQQLKKVWRLVVLRTSEEACAILYSPWLVAVAWQERAGWKFGNERFFQLKEKTGNGRCHVPT